MSYGTTIIIPNTLIKSNNVGYVCTITRYSLVSTYDKKKKDTYYYALPTSWPQLYTTHNTKTSLGALKYKG